MAFREKKRSETEKGSFSDESGKSEIMRRFKTHPFLFVGTVLILVIVIVAFVFVPALAPAEFGGGELVFGYYNKVPIKYVQNNYFHQAQVNIAQRYQVSPDNPDYFGVIQAVWEGAFVETVTRMGILDEMKQAGYTVPEEMVDREVASLPVFQENGRFSAAKYRSLDNNTRLNLWRQAQENVIAGRYLSDLGRVRISSKEAAFIGSLASPVRSFDLVVFPMSTYPDSEIAAYAEANAALFTMIHLSRITVSAGEREARQIYENVKNGVSPFEEAARANSYDIFADKGGDMGLQMAYELAAGIPDEAVRNSVINLPRGEMSDLIPVEGGWVFFRAEEAAYPADVYDPLHREKVLNYIKGNARGQIEDWLIARAEEFSVKARELGFAEAAAASYIESRSFGPIPLNYGDSGILGMIRTAGIPELENAGENQFFWRAAFSTPLKTVSDPFVAGDNVIVLYPREEFEAEASEVESIEMYYPILTSDSTDYAYRNYFMTNEKLDSRFQETFSRLWTLN